MGQHIQPVHLYVEMPEKLTYKNVMMEILKMEMAVIKIVQYRMDGPVQEGHQFHAAFVVETSQPDP